MFAGEQIKILPFTRNFPSTNPRPIPFLQLAELITDLDWDFDELITTTMLRERKFSKIPIYKDSIDNIKGILYAKDIIPYLMGSRPNVNLQALSREPFYVQETKTIDVFFF